MTIPPRSRAALPCIARTPCPDASVSSYGLYRLGTGHQKGSSGFCVGALQIPPLCKGRQGGLESSRGLSSFLPPHPLLTKEGTPLGTTHVLPRTHTISGRATKKKPRTKSGPRARRSGLRVRVP